MPGVSTDLADVATLLGEARDVTLLSHINPDADTIGGALALGLALRARGAEVRVSFAEPAELPESLRVLDTQGLVVPPEQLPESEQLIVAVDTPTVGRLGVLGERVEATKRAGGSVVVIDHHPSNTWYGTHNVVDAEAEASVVVVLRILDELGHELTRDIANCLYAGLLTDTSGFRRASGETHRMAARLVEAGVDTSAIGYELMDAHPFAWLRMLATVLSGAEFDPDGAQGMGLVHAVVTREVAAMVRFEDVESVIDVVRATSEAEVAIVLKETEPRTTSQRWTVSLRAKSAIDVSAAANACGGGGHLLAAGCTIDGTADEAMDILRKALANAPRL
ncbi:MAG: bifunctional oligoribonuclease/PAP phosphatase NrnA [Actinophytocola sp.]|nr:bifunctional oligoribonuclease/PAP phosphatase NrnA [Actinophytocola sp.]